LLNEKTLTADGIETTFASHFLFGTYLLGCLAMPVLECTPESRLVVVSSGGMYNTAFPDWATATSTGQAAYSGNLAYAYAKRGQVLLMERWAIEHPNVKCLSCHPGWTDTPAVDEAYGSQKKYLEPLRTPWQGSEGIAWLCVAPCDQLESGAFYLDREPRVKHMAGLFFSEGSFTKNSPSDVDNMIRGLGEMSHEVLAPSATSLAAPTGLLDAMQEPIELERFMAVGMFTVPSPHLLTGGPPTRRRTILGTSKRLQFRCPSLTRSRGRRDGLSCCSEPLSSTSPRLGGRFPQN
jgi:dehydrogenase/reductase SDR family protein 12